MSLPDTGPYLTPVPPAQPRTDRPFTVRSFGLTDPGRVRPANEDHFVIVELARIKLTGRPCGSPIFKGQQGGGR
jgi:hypothetical protein